MINKYFDYCEKIWDGWIKKENVQEEMFRKYFSIRYCPEPYLRFTNNESENTDLIHFVTTNPGGGFEQQDIEYILKNKSIIKNDQTYYNNAKNLADYYKEKLVSGSRYRIEHMKYLAQICGSSNFIQIETIPFHSEKLPDKRRLTKLIQNSSNSISEYINVTKDYLVDKNVISIQAANSKDLKKLNDWVKLQCELIGLNIKKSEYISIKTKNNKDTIGMYIEKKNNKIKALCLKAGSNDLPAKDGCNIIADKYNTLK